MTMINSNTTKELENKIKALEIALEEVVKEVKNEIENLKKASAQTQTQLDSQGVIKKIPGVSERTHNSSPAVIQMPWFFKLEIENLVKQIIRENYSYEVEKENHKIVEDLLCKTILMIEELGIKIL